MPDSSMGAATTQDVPGKPLREPDADRFDRRDRELQAGRVAGLLQKMVSSGLAKRLSSWET